MASNPSSLCQIVLTVGALAGSAQAFGTFPDPPPGATRTSTFVVSPAAVLIPEIGLAESPIVVSGVSGTVWDVNVVTNIDHAFEGDLVVSLVSPSGRPVILSSQVHRSLLDVTFDDASGLPVSAVAEMGDTFAPEGAFSVLAGDEPNGTWTLRCDDSTPGAGGIFTWRLEIATIDVEPVRSVATFSDASGIAFSDSVVVETDVSLSGFVCDVDVVVHVSHPTPKDLELVLITPDSRVCSLLAGRGNDPNFYANATFDDSAGQLGRNANPMLPLGTVTALGAFGRFTGMDAAGTWTLVIANDGPDSGTLLGWELRLTICAAPLPETFCTGAAPAPCPCGNNGALGNGCANAAHGGGARLTAIVPGGAAHVGDDVVLAASDLDPFQLVLFVQGTQAAGGGLGLPLGDGLLCATGQVVRLATRSSGFGSTSYPGFFDPPLAQRGLLPPAGGTRVYQALFRSSILFGPCHSGLNSTNGVRLTWLPQP